MLKRFALWLAAAGSLVLVLAAAASTVAVSPAFAAACRTALAASGAALTLSLALYLIHLVCVSRQAGAYRALLVLLHAGLACCLIGYQWGEYFGEKGTVFVREGMTARHYFDEGGRERALPFAVKCLDFKLSVYPGTLRVRDYETQLEITGGAGTVSRRLSVNSPVTVGGAELYQKDCGVTGDNPDAFIELDVRSEGNSLGRFRTGVGASRAVTLPGGARLAVLDFSPSLGEKDGGFFTINPDLMVNPAYLAEVSSPGRAPVRQWVLPQHPDTWKVAGLTLDFKDFHGIEYSVIAYVRTPARWLFYLGAALALAGCLGFALLRARRTT